MRENDVQVYRPDLEANDEPDFLRRTQNSTQSIHLDRFFTRDVTTSGSFDLRRIKDISFGQLLEAIPIPTLLVDASYSIIFTNEALQRISDDAPALIGKPLYTMFTGAGVSQKVLDSLQAIFADRKSQILEGLVRIGGKALWCKMHLRSVRFRDQRSVLAIMEDLTAEKKQLLLNEKYQQLVQIFPTGIAEFSLNRPIPLREPAEETVSLLGEAQFLGGNPEFARMSGKESAAELKGAPLHQVFPFDPKFRHLYHRWIKDGVPVRSFETRERVSNGERRYFENTLVGNVKNGYLLGLWGLRQDITQRKESEQALRSARDKLEERVKERTEELLEANSKLRMEITDRQAAEEELAKTVSELKAALAKVKTLSGLLPICSSCKKIRDDRGYWTQVEVFVRDHSEADFTHSICPDCAMKLYPDFYNPAQ